MLGSGEDAADAVQETFVLALLRLHQLRTAEAAGAGTGLNLEHYPATITNLTLVEPNRHMRKRLRRRVGRLRLDAAVLDARPRIASSSG